MKHCPKCGQNKPLTAEHWLPRKDSKDGYRGICRLCWNAQHRPNKRRHYQKHAERIRQERRQWRKDNPEKAKLRDARYSLLHREQRIERNRRYYWLNHERILRQKQIYDRTRRPLRIDMGPDMPNTRNVDMWVWTERRNREQAQQAAIAILSMAMRALTEDERRFLLAFESHEYDVTATAEALKLSQAVADRMMERIRAVTVKAQEVIATDHADLPLFA